MKCQSFYDSKCELKAVRNMSSATVKVDPFRVYALLQQTLKHTQVPAEKKIFFSPRLLSVYKKSRLWLGCTHVQACLNPPWSPVDYQNLKIVCTEMLD